jgi:L-idonate 5-dehydrogenase
MKACVIRGKRDLAIEERGTPEISATQVLIDFRAGGICGSDLHYFNQGQVGAFVVREPMILGHEVAGVVSAVGADVTAVKAGDRVAVHPARPCKVCVQCRRGRSNLCPNVRFFGSAARFPHVQGAFAEQFAVDEEQCFKLSENVSFTAAACAEPLAVALHAVRRAGDILGKRVLIAGAGPIGLMVLLVARFAGAAEVAITDQLSQPLLVAEKLGASQCVLMTGQQDASLERLLQEPFDVAIEAAGAYAATTFCIDAVAPGSRVVQLGLLPPVHNESLRISGIIGREIELVGSFRFFEEFGQAVKLLNNGQISPAAILSAQYPLDDALAAFEFASDRTRALKVMLVK